MSLTTVEKRHIETIAKGGTISGDEYIIIIKGSLPKAWAIVESLMSQAKQTGEQSIFAPPTLDDETRGELLRMLASTSIRETIESFFGVRLAFQNCHKVGVFPVGAQKEYSEFTSIHSQIINQSPEMRDC